MAQAARLSLRMQKELKLLLSDPPPGVSLPLISSHAGADLSSIDADIEGPEGSVYAKGVFRIKIQIPERYPFQPPNVTFATPIYHPNIDNGGRICLDILNLPPKGSWQPSLNISTVLTSIGLLLSEPNPDDGLMCDASREYKYNRQAFDQKARSMTQKYAMAGASRNTCSDPGVELNPNPRMMEATEVSNEARNENEGMKSVQKKFWGMSRKLSLDASTSVRKADSNMDTDKITNPHSCASVRQGKFSIEGTKEEKRDDKDKKPKLSLSSHRDAMCSSEPKGNKSDAYDMRCEKVGFLARGRKLSLGQKCPRKRMEIDNKENISPVKKSQLSRAVNASAGCGINKEFSLSPASDLQGSARNTNNSKGADCQAGEETTIPDTVIVLDSDDSDDEDGQSSRLKGLLGRKRLKKWNCKV